jgi:hypothetical protein
MNIPKLANLDTSSHVISTYRNEKSKYDKLHEEILKQGIHRNYRTLGN